VCQLKMCCRCSSFPRRGGFRCDGFFVPVRVMRHAYSPVRLGTRATAWCLRPLLDGGKLLRALAAIFYVAQQDAKGGGYNLARKPALGSLSHAAKASRTETWCGSKGEPTTKRCAAVR